MTESAGAPVASPTHKNGVALDTKTETEGHFDEKFGAGNVTESAGAPVASPTHKNGVALDTKTETEGHFDEEFGAGNETRTRDPNLGKVVLYQLSYSRFFSIKENGVP